jgi:hypothetical protein
MAAVSIAQVKLLPFYIRSCVTFVYLSCVTFVYLSWVASVYLCYICIPVLCYICIDSYLKQAAGRGLLCHGMSCLF